MMKTESAHMKSRLIIALLLALFAAPAVLGQEVADTIKIRTRVVFLDALVKDKRTGIPISDLKPDNFELFDDGKPRTISYFSAEGQARSVAEAVRAWRQKQWEAEGLYRTDLSEAKNPYYTHVMFPYPSGDTLHIGHVYNYAPADAFARFMRMKGHTVFTPIGFDAFGLPAENHAIQNNVDPRIQVGKNIELMTEQLKRLGCM